MPKAPADPLAPPWKGTDPAPTARPPEPPTLLEPEYAGAYRDYAATGSPEHASALLGAVTPVLHEALRSYAGSEAQSGTALARAKAMALEAVQRYDPARAKLRTHLLSHLRGLRRQTARSAAGFYAPEQHRIDAQRLAAALPDLKDDLGRDPSDAELAGATGLDLKRIAAARKVTGALSGSQVADDVRADRRDPEGWANWLRIVHADLDPVDQVILEHSAGMHGKPVLPATAIAKRVGLSGGAVSQRKLRIQQMLDEYDTFLGRADS